MERQAPVGTVAMSAAFPSMAAFPVSLHAMSTPEQNVLEQGLHKPSETGTPSLHYFLS